MRVTVNAAMSADGKIALRGGKALRLSDDEDMKRVHSLRDKADAIVVGIGTIMADDPQLTVRHVTGGRNPVRVVLDSNMRTPPQARVLDGSAKTIIVTAKGKSRPMPNAELVEAGVDRVDLRLMLRELSARGLERVLVEGGATVIGSFLRAGVVDELYTYIAPVVVGGGAPSLVEGPGAERAEHILRLKLAEARPYGGGALLRYLAS